MRHGRSVRMMAVGAALTGLLLCLIGAWPGGGDRAWAAEPAGEVAAPINAERGRRGLRQLTIEPALSERARSQLDHFVRTGEFTLRKTRSGPSVVDELLRLNGFLRGGYATGRAVAEDLISDHDANAVLTDGTVGQIGVAHVADPVALPDGRMTADLWLVMFGTDRADPIPGADRDLLAEVNRVRASHGLSPVARNRTLDRAAVSHAKDMATRQFFAHSHPSGRPTLIDRVHAAGYQYRQIGENLAIGQTSARQAVQAWIDSPGHARILFADWATEVGLAYVTGPAPSGKGQAPHLWVAVLGTPLGR